LRSGKGVPSTLIREAIREVIREAIGEVIREAIREAICAPAGARHQLK